jgi:hypothetical protein
MAQPGRAYDALYGELLRPLTPLHVELAAGVRTALRAAWAARTSPLTLPSQTRPSRSRGPGTTTASRPWRQALT